MNESNTIKSGHGIARFLRDIGITHVFGIPDGLTLALYDGFKSTEGIEHVLLNDERNAAFAADAYGRITGKPGVCDAGAAGSMNFPIALTEAQGSASPILALIGMIRAKKLLRNFPHEIKIYDTLKPITKWIENVTEPENLPRFLAYAIKKATTGRPGAVALVIAEDVLKSNLKVKAFTSKLNEDYSVNANRVAPDDQKIEQVVKKILRSKQPAIFSGGGAVLSGAYNEIAELSQMLSAPVFTTTSGKGIMVPDKSEDDLHFGTIGLFGIKPNHRFLKTKVDLLIAVGNRLTEDDTAFFKYPSRNTEMIQIDVDPSEIGLNYEPLGIIGDPKTTIRKIIEYLKNSNYSTSQEILKRRKRNINLLREKSKLYQEGDQKKWLNTEPIKPQRVVKSISDNMSKDDYLVTDASACSRWIGPYFLVKSLGRKIITPRGVGPTGFGVGALIGTCYAADAINQGAKKPKKILLTGDGSLMDGGLSEFETIVKLGLDCTIVVLNNQALGYIKFAQSFIFNWDYYEVDRPNTDFSKISEAFGGKGKRVEKLKDLDSVIRDSIIEEGFNLVDVVVDPNEFLPPNYYFKEWDFY